MVVLSSDIARGFLMWNFPGCLTKLFFPRVKALCFVSWCTEGSHGLWSHLAGQSGAWVPLRGSSDSGSNPALLGKGTVSGCRGTFRVWGNSSSIISFYSVWEILVSVPSPNYEMVKHRTARCLGDLLWDCDVPPGWTTDALSVCKSFPCTYWYRRLIAALHTRGHSGVFNVRDKSCQELLEKMKMSIWEIGSASLGGGVPRFNLQELKWPFC